MLQLRAKKRHLHVQYMWLQRPPLNLGEQYNSLFPRAYVYYSINHFHQAECHRVCLLALNKHCQPSAGITFTYCYCHVYVCLCTYSMHVYVSVLKPH